MSLAFCRKFTLAADGVFFVSLKFGVIVLFVETVPREVLQIKYIFSNFF